MVGLYVPSNTVSTFAYASTTESIFAHVNTVSFLTLFLAMHAALVYRGTISADRDGC